MYCTNAVPCTHTEEMAAARLRVEVAENLLEEKAKQINRGEREVTELTKKHCTESWGLNRMIEILGITVVHEELGTT